MTSAIEARLDADKLIEQACELAGSDDFGDADGWRDNLGRLLDDFDIRIDRNVVHVCNAPSPAATASLAIGAAVARAVEPALPGR